MGKEIVVGASRETNELDRERWWNEVVQIYDKNIN